MTATLVIPQSVYDAMVTAAENRMETAGVLLASVVGSGTESPRLLVRGIRWIDDSAYQRRERDSLSIASQGYVHALAEAETLQATPLFLHSHPGGDGIPVQSIHDREVDRQIADLFRLRSGSPLYGAIVVSPRAGGLTFTGHVEGDDGARLRLDRLWMVGDRLRLIRAYDSTLPELPTIFDRNIRAFGSEVQQTLGALRVAVVGCGGTGSALAEQAVRLGVRDFVLIDPATLSASNVTRVYGSTPADVGHPKVEVLARHLSRIAPNARVEAIQSTVVAQATARMLVPCDLVFGCTDDNAGRLVLSRIATYLVTPVIDCGVLLTSDAEDRLTGIDGRVTVLVPGQACLVCRGRIDMRRASAELLTNEERTKRVDEGYAPALGRVEPAVVTFTTAIAAAAVSELLERLVGYGPEPRPSEILMRWHDREISTNVARPRDGHYCDPSVGTLGTGENEPFLEQIWAG
jgi:hypothetical protein